MSERICKDCLEEGITTKRDASYPGPRCFSHNRAKKKERRTKAREDRWEKVYSITAEQYAAILEAQNGFCAICGRSNGSTRTMAVDHDHKCCAGPTSCGGCVRAILCSPCNQFVGWIRDSVEAAERLVTHLTDPIGRRVLDNWDKR